MPDRKARILRDLDADCIAPAIPAKPENVHQGGATPIAVRASRRLRGLRGGYSDDAEGCKAMLDAACRSGRERAADGCESSESCASSIPPAPSIPRTTTALRPLARFDLDEVPTLARTKRYFLPHALRQTGKVPALPARPCPTGTPGRRGRRSPAMPAGRRRPASPRARRAGCGCPCAMGRGKYHAVAVRPVTGILRQCCIEISLPGFTPVRSEERTPGHPGERHWHGVTDFLTTGHGFNVLAVSCNWRRAGCVKPRSCCSSAAS